jgi:hypothetical protein
MRASRSTKTRQFASANDLRRAFDTRGASKVKPATLQLLMRHASIHTTLDYYMAMDTDDVASERWQAHANRLAQMERTPA